jgi:hypothetical protein
MELNEEIKKLRQSCFKANYKKRQSSVFHHWTWTSSMLDIITKKTCKEMLLTRSIGYDSLKCYLVFVTKNAT